jgi:DNA polymerase I-like protein with 3'-5' exonuclease and polymerase domains
MVYLISANIELYGSEDYQVSSVEECLLYFENHEFIAVDTETQGRDCHSKKILSLQLGDSENQFVIDVRSVNILHFKQLLETKTLLLHNSKFDYKFLKKAGIQIEHIYDTMLAECVLFAGFEKYGYGLDKVVFRYCKVVLDKSTRGEFFMLKDQPFSTDQILYASRDVRYLHTVREKQLEIAAKYNLEYCIDLENKVVKALADIEYNGMGFNKERWLQNAEDYETELNRITLELDQIVLSTPSLSSFKLPYIQTNLFGEAVKQVDINYASPTQILAILKKLGFNVEDTSDRTLGKIKNNAFTSKLQEFREVAKIVSTYGKSFVDVVNPTTNRVHTSFWQVVSTGRVSSGNKEENAPNLQNIPAANKFRNCFTARPGFLWVSSDYSGQELGIMAEGSGEQGFIEVINRGDDLHSFVGSMMMGRTITKADKEERTKAKTINFMKPYGGGPPKLADLLDIPIEESKKLFELYEKAFPILNNWLAEQSKLAVQKGYSVTFPPCRRRRWYPEKRQLTQELKDSDFRTYMKLKGGIERNGSNQPIQGTGADMTKEALVEVRELINFYNNKYHETVAYFLCTVHDAIDVEVREDLAQEFSEQMENIMLECGKKYLKQVKITVDTTITPVWQK